MRNERTWTGEFLLSEARGYRSRAAIHLPQRAEPYLDGTVLSPNFSEYVGSGPAIGILYGDFDASAGSVDAVMIQSDAEVRPELVLFDEEDEQAVWDALELLNIYPIPRRAESEATEPASGTEEATEGYVPTEEPTEATESTTEPPDEPTEEVTEDLETELPTEEATEIPTEDPPPDPPTFISVGSPAVVADAATMDVVFPTHQAGDLLLLLVETARQNAGLDGGESGWTLLGPNSIGSSGTGSRLYTWVKAATGTADTVTVARSTNPIDHMYGVGLVFRGADVAGVTGNSGFSNAGGTQTDGDAQTTTVDNSLILGVCARSNDASGAAVTWTDPQGNFADLDELFDAGTTTGNGGGISVAAGLKATAGVTGTPSIRAAFAGSTEHAGLLLIVPPAP